VSRPEARIEEVRGYWEHHPLAASSIPHELFTRQYFDAYDMLRESNESPQFSAELHEYDSFTGKKVLDVGSGNGYVLSRYAKAGAEVVGVDLTQTAVDLCRRRFELMGLEGSFDIANAESLPFEDATFDCVCSMGVVHHTPDTERAVAEIHRVLKPGGRVILMVYHRNSVLYQVNFRVHALLMRRDIQELVNEVDGVGNPKGDVYSRAELARLLRDFEQLELFTRLVQGWMLAPRLTHRIPDRWLTPLERRWGWFLYAKGFKPS
jgi:SAM-dependent methyltransferase